MDLNSQTVKDIIPPGIELVRGALNNIALDLMYFTSNRYAQEIFDSATRNLNKLFSLFMERNPSYANLWVAHNILEIDQLINITLITVSLAGSSRTKAAFLC